jgi:murein DD-endopeptidase MepM/ murein hydrolase activator NlpD
MQMRRVRPVAALTLAFVAAPFLAATAVAAQSGTASASATPKRVISVSWVSATSSSVQKAVKVITVAAETVTPPPPAAPAPALRAQAPPPPPPPSDINDVTTWIFPADGPITSPFGSRWGRRHEGVDIDAAYGAAVIAPQRGTVIHAGPGLSGYGQVVEIDHGNGITTLYAHLSAITVRVGDAVAQGQQVGAVGKTGAVTAAHLHYEVHIGGVPRNPMPWLTAPHSMQGHPG